MLLPCSAPRSRVVSPPAAVGKEPVQLCFWYPLRSLVRITRGRDTRAAIAGFRPQPVIKWGDRRLELRVPGTVFALGENRATSHTVWVSYRPYSCLGDKTQPSDAAGAV